jgi:hypothetical protein
MRRESKRIYNRNYDNPLRHVSLALKHSLQHRRAHPATLSPFAHNLGHLGPRWPLASTNCPVIAFASTYYISIPVTPSSLLSHSATRQVGVAVIKKNVLSGFFHSTGSVPIDGLTSSLGPCPRDTSMLSLASRQPTGSTPRRRAMLVHPLRLIVAPLVP